MAYSDKDNQAIASQVCAKIACDLTNKELPVDDKIAEFAVLFESVRSIVFDVIFNIDTSAPSPLKLVKDAFPGSTEEPSAPAGELTVKGKQNGPLPAWLTEKCAEDGVDEVYDNRHQLKEFPKRPAFKEVGGEGRGYWPPKK